MQFAEHCYKSSFAQTIFLVLHLEIPGKPTVAVSTVRERTALVKWSYTAGEDEAVVDSFFLRFETNMHEHRLSGSSRRKELTNLRPFTSYSVTIKVSSVLGDGSWSDSVNFTTLTASKLMVLTKS